MDGAKVGRMEGLIIGASEVGSVEGDEGASVGAVDGTSEYSQLQVME